MTAMGSYSSFNSAVQIAARAEPLKSRVQLVSSIDLERDTLLEAAIKGLAFTVETMKAGASTIGEIVDNRANIDMIVLDRRGEQNADGKLIRELSTDPRISHIPIVLIAGSGPANEVGTAIVCGLAAYLIAPFPLTLLDLVLRSALVSAQRTAKVFTDGNNTGNLGNRLACAIETCKLTCRTPLEARSLIPELARLFPNPVRAEMGLLALVDNAIEHGNLEIGGTLRNELIKGSALQQEVYGRLHKAAFAKRKVEIVVARREDGVMAMVTDEGRGFDWRQFIDVNPSLANAETGRGIPRARHIAFDKLSYNEKGNQAVALMLHSRTLKW